MIDFQMDGAPSEGCSTTTILAQLSIEPDAGAGAVHTIMFIGLLLNSPVCSMPGWLNFNALGRSSPS